EAARQPPPREVRQRAQGEDHAQHRGDPPHAPAAPPPLRLAERAALVEVHRPLLAPAAAAGSRARSTSSASLHTSPAPSVTTVPPGRAAAAASAAAAAASGAWARWVAPRAAADSTIVRPVTPAIGGSPAA